MCKTCFQYHRREGADIASVHVACVERAPRLCMEPGVGGTDHTLRRSFDGPSVGRAVVICQKALDRRLRGNAADRACANAIGDRDSNALEGRAEPSGIRAPWKSWLTSLCPRSECCPIVIVSALVIDSPIAGAPLVSEAPVTLRLFGGKGSCTQSEISLALGARANMRRVECEADEGETTDEVADHGRDLVPDQVVHD